MPKERVEIPHDLAASFGLSSDADVECIAQTDGLLLRRSIDHLAKVYVEPTSACNLSCRTCVRNAWSDALGTMPLALFQQLIDQLREFSGPLTVHFAGYGEPLAHRNLVEMVRLAKGIGARVEITTNGTLLDAGIAQAFVDLRVDRVWISVDGATPACYSDIRHGAELNPILKNIRQLHYMRWRVQQDEPMIGLAFVAMRSNVHELPELRRVASSVGASQVMVSNVLPHTEDMVDEILYGRAVSMTTYVQSPWVPEVKLPRMDVSEETAQALYQLMRSRMNVELAGVNLATGNDYCRFVNGGMTVVGCDGAVSPCPPLMHSYPVYVTKRWRQVRRYTLGNIAQQPLGEIWRSPEYRAFRRKVRAFEFPPCSSCNGCDLADGIEEDCFGNEFPVCGGCLWAQGIVRCP